MCCVGWLVEKQGEQGVRTAVMAGGLVGNGENVENVKNGENS